MACLGFGWRHVVMGAAFFGFFVVYSLRVNLSVALVAMVNQTAVKMSSKTHNHNGTQRPCNTGSNFSYLDSQEDGPYVWDENTQGLILSSFFYGYIIMQIPGGWLAEKIGGKPVYGAGTLCAALLTLLVPLAAKNGVGFLVALRVLMGMAEAVTFPAMHSIYSKWVPPLEKSKLPSFVDTGAYMGTVIAFALSGYLCSTNFLGGWPSVFYVFGTIGVIWFCFWQTLVTSTPGQHRWISAAELNYIETEIDKEKRTDETAVPWKGIVTSLPVWAIVVSHTSHNFGFYTLLTELPSYMKKILGFDVKQNGLLSSLPYVCQAILQNAVGQLADLARRRGYASTVLVRKICDSIGHLGPAICLLVVGFTGCNTVVSVTLLTLAVALSGFIGAGFFVNHLDVGPSYAGLLFSISNTFATVPGMVAPTMVGLITNNNETVSAWRTVFIITTVQYCIAEAFYLIFGSGTVQKWAKRDEDGSRRESEVNDYRRIE